MEWQAYPDQNIKMKTALLIWEMGGGLGHLVNLKRRAANLEADGFSVKYALKDIKYVDKRAFFDCNPSNILDVPLIPAIQSVPGNALNFSDLLYRNGYTDTSKLTNAANEYKRLIDRVAPDHIVLDFSPLAQVVAKDYNVSKEITGSPFTVPCVNNTPGSVYAFPLYFPSTDLKGLHKIERDLTDTLNTVTNRNETLKELFTENVLAKERILVIPELDFFHKFRPNANYQWDYDSTINSNESKESFVFGYLKNLGFVNELIEALSIKDPQTQFLFYINNFTLQKKLPNVEIINKTLNPKEYIEAIRQSKYVITNGSGIINLDALLSGKPILSYPLHLENLLNASMAVFNTAGGIITYKETFNRDIDDFYTRLNEFVHGASLIQTKYNTKGKIL
jgi:hypothetical protein